MKRHWLWLLLIALLGAWTWNLWYYDSQKLEKPLFLKHYYELPASMLSHISLYYITNTDSSRKPFRLELPNGISLNVAHVQVRDQRGRLQLNEAVVIAPEKRILDQSDTSGHFDRLQVYYNDGLVDTVSIGNIIVQPGRDSGDPLSMSSSSGSSNGTGGATYRATRDVTISAVRSSFPELLSDAVHVEFNGKKSDEAGAFPMILRAEQFAEMKYRFQLPDGDVRRYHAYQLFIGYEEAGSDTIAGRQYVNKQPDLYGDDLAKYVRLRKGEKP